MERQPDPAAVQRTFDRLAELLGGAGVRKSFQDDPRRFLDEHDLRELPEPALQTLASLSPDELALFARVQRKLRAGGGPGEVGIVF